MRSLRTPTGTPAARRPTVRRRARAWLAALGAPLLLLAGGLALAAPASPAASAAFPSEAGAPMATSEPYLSAVGAFTAQRDSAASMIGDAVAVLAPARIALADSAGRVLTEGTRAELAAVIRSTTIEAARADGVLDQAGRLVDSHRSTGSYFSAWADFSAAAGRLQSGIDDSLAALTDELARATEAVAAAVADWQAEQERLAVEEAAQAAQAQAARVAAEPAIATVEGAGASGGPGTGGTATSGAATLAKHVWTSGFQTEIDACNGAVDVAARYGVAVIAEHWSCGGSAFPGSGTVITLTGVRSGSYLVGDVVAVLDAHTDGTSDVPRGYDLLYQTCINGSDSAMSFTVLTRIG